MINLLNKVQLVKIRDKLGLDKKKLFLIILVCLIIIIYLDLTFLTKLQLKKLKNLEPKIIKMKKDLDTLTKNLAIMQELKKKQIATNQMVIAKAKKPIAEEQISSILQYVSDMANNNDVKIVQMKPSKELPNKQEKTSAVEKFTLLSITLDLFCDYHHLGKFINDLENAGILIAVEKIKIMRQEKDYLQQKVNLVLKTYVKK